MDPKTRSTTIYHVNDKGEVGEYTYSLPTTEALIAAHEQLDHHNFTPVGRKPTASYPIKATPHGLLLGTCWTRTTTGK